MGWMDVEREWYFSVYLLFETGAIFTESSLLPLINTFFPPSALGFHMSNRYSVSRSLERKSPTVESLLGIALKTLCNAA